MRRLRMIFAALALALPPGMAAAQAPTDAPRPIVSVVLGEAQTRDRSFPGVVRARVDVALGFQTLGRLTARNVDLGDVVHRGDVLATLDPDDLQGKVRSAEAAAEAAKVQLQTAQSAADRTRALVERDVATTAQLEQAEQSLAAAIAADQQAQSELIRARDTESYAEMRAPFDGVISAVHATPGAVVAAGEPIVDLSGQDELEVVIDAQAALVARLESHDRFEVWSPNHPELRRQATLARIEPVADAATRSRRVRLSLDDPQGFLLGALVRARPVFADANRLTVPAAAIFQKDGESRVWIVTRQGKAATVSARRVQTTGPEIEGMFFVAAGLRPGDEVVIRGIHSLREGQAVGASVTP
ncbi:efflux RND transporter periplasmic adaptor subunit [Paracoccus sp. KR1-242]|uniref:efflux RND transporter periplasmic adaptor subunit n=1 Tax=Paracoccus sp. KR1-242 TaxID=3410028 RepID=UPI003C08EC1F